MNKLIHLYFNCQGILDSSHTSGLGYFDYDLRGRMEALYIEDAQQAANS